MTPSIAIVGMACRYPDADTPAQLWENVLAKRRAFRRLPEKRLRESDYVSNDRSQTDRTYRIQGAVLEGFQFDRQRFRVPGDTFRSADLAHWLALQVAADALEDAGWPDAQDLPRDTTGVLLGNTLTGEFSRANVMRLRWPYVRRVVDAALAREDWSPEERRRFLESMEPLYKAPFPEVGGETLAGGLANTIAGRICNQYDLHGGGYTVDGACASSLLAVSQACAALTTGDLDVALAGGVDLSLDPFELVGFARLGALAPHEMTVYDERSAGFWPGEGCGVVALMREQDALAQGKRIYATLQGWGVSSDGSGGLTRPEVHGQLMAVRRAYQRAGYGADTVGYFEGHGTGTAVGDPAEIQVLSQAIREAAALCPRDRAAQDVPRPALGSIKANIGHTKAAAGTAGLIKAALAVHHRILPPTTACDQPTALLRDDAAALRVLQQAEDWPTQQALRASVSAMGFGGINTHVTLREATAVRRGRTVRSRRVVQDAIARSRSSQDHELFCWRGTTATELLQQVETIQRYAALLSLSEMTDLAHRLAQEQQRQQHDAHAGELRAAVLASTPAALATRLATLRTWLQETPLQGFRSDEKAQVFLGVLGDTPPRVGLLFPGQASPSYFTGGAWSTRFATIDDLYARLDVPPTADPRETAVAQPAICCAERAGMLALQEWGMQATVGIGHSVGELAALQWAGVYDEDTLLRLASARGSCMSRFGARQGAMASIAVDEIRAAQLVQGTRVVIAGMNAPQQTILSGDAQDIQHILQRAAQQGLSAVELRVSHAFHSPHMQGAVQPLRDMLQRETWQTPTRTVLSTITGAPVTHTRNLTERLVQQLVQPVRFTEALQHAASQVDLWIECGPGTVLSGLVRQQSAVPVVALDAGSASLAGLLRAFASGWTLGAAWDPRRLFADRFTRQFDLDWQPRFLENPCEQAPVDADALPLRDSDTAQPETTPAAAIGPRHDEAGTPLEVVRQLVADHLELPLDMVRPDSQLLNELHLNSITISEIVAQAARALGLDPPHAVTEFANSSVDDIAAALATLLDAGAPTARRAPRMPHGVDSWVRAFETVWVEEARADAETPSSTGSWHIVAPEDHPFAAALRESFHDGSGGSGVVVCMPTEMTACCAELLVHSAQHILRQSGTRHYVVVQNTSASGAPGGGFARTLHLENPGIHTCVIDVPWDHPEAAAWVRHEVASTSGFREVRFDAAGVRCVPRLRVAERRNSGVRLTPEDVVLVTGGGKGIGVESALGLARHSGAQVLLLGRSDPASDAELAANLDRLRGLGARAQYVRADVTDAAAVQAAVDDLQRTCGRITMVVHAAGSNAPQRLETLDDVAFRRTFAPKVLGLRNVLQALPQESLRAVITFSSIIGHTGLAGEADYALANDWASRLTQMYGDQHPDCLCLALGWSVWSGSGMGERLGRIEFLRQQGVADIPTDRGVAMLLELLQQPPRATRVIVAGRFGTPDTVQWLDPQLPLRRFVELPRVHVPGVELVVDAQLETRTDPYLQDHVVQRQMIFPAVLGLEAMAQVAMALQASQQPPRFEAVQFQRPVVVEADAPRTIRLAALHTGPQEITVALRSDANDFSIDHFRAVCRFDAAPAPARLQDGTARGEVSGRDSRSDGEALVALNPTTDLYDGHLLFHRGRFQRLQGYHSLQARSCDADVSSDGATEWFGTWMPHELCLGDPAARDAAIHAIQACLPHARLLPVGVERIHTGVLLAHRAHRVHAIERLHEGDEYVYDMQLEDVDGHVVETWEGLRLRRMEPIVAQRPWSPALFGPYAERRLQELLGSDASNGASPHVSVLRDAVARRSDNTDAAVRLAVGGPVHVWRRPDGKPQSDTLTLSASHSQGFTMAMTGTGRIGCDLQEVTERHEDVWRDLLGQTRLQLAQQLAARTQETLDAAASQVWATMECAKKAGIAADAPLTLEDSQPDGWTALRCGAARVISCVTHLQDAPHRMALSLLAETSDASI